MEALSATDVAEINQAHAMGTDFAEKIFRYVHSLDVTDDWYLYRLRVKDPNSLGRKLLLKRDIRDSEYGVRDVTDVVGLRIVALNRAQIPEIVASLVDLLFPPTGLSIVPSPFSGDGIEECKIYHTSEPLDFALSQTHSILMNSRLRGEAAVELAPSRETDKPYSSIHIIVRGREASSDGALAGWSVPVEIQVRTVLEDAWSEIDHKWRYGSQKQRSPELEPRNLFFFHHLVTLKKFVDSSIDYIDLIMRQAMMEGAEIDSTSVKALNDLEATEMQFREAGLDDEFIRRHNIGRFYIRQASRFLDSDPTRGRNKVFEAAQHFEDLRRAVEQSSAPEEARQLASYFCRMEEAFSHTLCNDRPSQMRAERLYQGVLREYPDDFVARFRMAQVQGRLGEPNEAMKSLRQLMAEVDDGTQEQTRALLNPMTLNVQLLKALGINCWRAARRISDQSSAEADAEATALQLYREAYETSIKAGKALGQFPPESLKKHRLQVLNNSLDYCARLVRVDEENEASWRSALKEHLDELIDALRGLPDEPLDATLQQIDHVQYLDSMLLAFEYMESTADARMCAHRVLGLLQGGADPEGGATTNSGSSPSTTTRERRLRGRAGTLPRISEETLAEVLANVRRVLST